MSTTTTTTRLGPRPWQGSIHASITRLNLDTVETVTYSNGEFDRRLRVVSGPSSHAVLVLDDQARSTLLAELQAELAAPPAGTDVAAIETFVDLLQESLKSPPSHRFNAARFGAVTFDESTNTYFGHLVLGVDMAGTVHDHNHQLSFEQHLVILPPGPYAPLSAADRASLAEALKANPPADNHWHEILIDAGA